MIDELRAQISATDRELVALVNRRIGLVAELKRYKDEHRIAFVDPEREAALFDERAAENEGPLSDEGLRAFYAELLALTKRELG
ncbi:MAG: chorismate mutase [Gaiellaceae bacterium]